MRDCKITVIVDFVSKLPMDIGFYADPRKSSYLFLFAHFLFILWMNAKNMKSKSESLS